MTSIGLIDRRKRSPAILRLHQEIKRDHFQNGVRVKDLAKKYNYSQSTISVILGNKRRLLRTYGMNDDTKTIKNYYNNRTLILEMEKHLFVWIKERQKRNESVSQNSISQKALEIYDELKAELPKLYASVIDGFRASEGWFSRFSKRNGIDRVTHLIKEPDGNKSTSASGEGGPSTSDVDPVRQRVLVDEVDDSVNSSSKITDASNVIYLKVEDPKNSAHKLPSCTEYLNNNDNIETEFDNSVSTERIENTIGESSMLLRSENKIGDNSKLLHSENKIGDNNMPLRNENIGDNNMLLRSENIGDNNMQLRTEHKIGDNSMLLRTENKIVDNSMLLPTKIEIGDNSTLSRNVPPPPPPAGIRLNNSVHTTSEKVVNADNRIEDEFEAFGKYVAMSLRNMPISNALSVENQIYSAINNERRLIILQNNQSGINIGIKMEIEDEPI